MANPVESLALAEQVLVTQLPAAKTQSVIKTTMIQAVGIPSAYAVAEQVLMQVIPAANTLTVAKTLMVKAPPQAGAWALAEQVLTIPPTNTIDYGVVLEASSAGFIPATGYDVVLEVSAGLPYGADQYGVVVEVSAATTLAPAKPMQRIVWFTPS